jgi:putative endonuclease
MYKRHEIGKLGEDLACRYLQNQGYKILERNFEARQGEIDIIALDKSEIIFIEVKTRSNISYGKPAEAVNEIKQNHLIKTIEYYIYSRHLENEFIRIDIIEIYLWKNKYRVNHIKQVI